MSRSIMLGTLLLLAATLACTFTVPSARSISGSGNVITVHESQTGFDRVDISHTFDATIEQADDFSIIIRIDDNFEEDLRVIKQGDTLRVGLDPDRSYTIRSATLEVDITLPVLAGLELSGASRGTISGFESDRPFDGDVSGASSLRGDILAGDINLDISGASLVVLDGIGRDLTLDASGASSVDLEDFALADADIKLSGASNATVNVSGTLDVEASGASRLEYVGNPELGVIDTSGASSVKEK